MNLSFLFENKVTIAILSAIGGSIISAIAQYLLNKRSVLSYNVKHNRIGLSTDDIIYGSVRVTWNNNPINHLFLSTVQVRNESMKDFESVVVRIFSNVTMLLTQSTSIKGTTRIIEFTNDYKSQIHVPEGQEPLQNQFDLFRRQRDYIVPVINRGQILEFEFLNAATSEQIPTIWVDILHKGIICKFMSPKSMFWGVPQMRAMVIGTIICIAALAVTIIYIKSLVLEAILAFLLGWLVLIPGALTIKSLRKICHIVAG